MLVIRNIGELVLFGAEAAPMVNSTALRRIENAYVSIDEGKIVAFGADAECVALEWFDVVDAQGGCVIPGLVDFHTHTVFAGTREHEFVMRIEGRSYAEIAEAGGGIKTTVKSVRAASEDELVALALPRLERMLTYGVTTVEIKSGYGLSVADELKMLRAARRLNDLQPVEIVGTYLAAHTVPAEYTDNREAYLDLVCSDELMGTVVQEGLAEFCDIFTERTAFTIDESRRVLLAGKERGLIPRLHADQITQIGASRLAAEVGAMSADHLETIDDGGIDAMISANVIAGLLPGCSWYLGVEQGPARRIIDAGLPVALATDFNPGSSVVESLPLCMNIACTQMKMTPAECLIGATANAAAAINRGDRLGSIRTGLQADLVVLDVPSVERWMYEAGRNCVRTVIKNGQVAFDRDASNR